jgi:hypothetical protein
MIDFKDTLAKFTYTLSFQEKGKFPSQPQQNPKGQYNAMQVVLEANTWINSNQSLLFTVVRLLKHPFLNLMRKMMSQYLRVRKGLNLNIAKKPVLPFSHAMTKQREVNHDSKIFEIFK